MPVPYEERRKRREALRKQLQPALQPYIALRNAEPVSHLSPKSQETLIEALTSGNRIRITDAIDHLSEYPQATVADILQISAKKKDGSLRSSVFPKTLGEGVVDPEAIRQMTALIRACFVDMPQVSAEALAASDVMSDLRSIQATHQYLFQSPHGKTDFVMIAFYELLQQDVSRLDKIISENVSLQHAIRDSNAGWPR